ncbi:PREDICTED: oxysterol-binding protein 1-like [Amphimedon queenslandica]|uniref:Oxysterol-binding protein n=2 Tax=Amphimedon queenslandica TaxID=400682 RepID=A0A1X7USE0_AMPQE|nr:PREDICTED: oxysterol-binding protein 1-like [Amphimedon queenslandica]|eukprot:XP_019852777.1 PREDICTED: oxysterol-binding protein 1-like [Amphimedon queenslandica]
MATSNDNDVESGDELFEDAVEVQQSTANGHCDAKRMPVANPDAFEFLFPMLLEQSSITSFRKKLPFPRERSTVGLWAFLKNLVGKDVTRISMPITFNEPISFLQRLCEDVEYIELCHKAAEAETIYDRLAYLAALASSCYVCTLTRHSKPFNPLLGETYELVRKDLGYCLIAEQVSHHPPITALHCESDKWVFWEEYKLDIKFRGQWVRIQPTGLVHFKTKLDGYHYSWNKPHTTVHNLIIGQLWADHEGVVTVTSHQTGDRAVVNWNPHSKSKDNYKQINGEVTTKDGIVIYNLEGRWDKGMDRVDPDGSNRNNLWTAHEPLPDNDRQYGFTLFSMSLNEHDDSVECPTDSRRRPDQRLLEEGQIEEAGEEKVRLEEKQRAARKARDKKKEEWKPRWFTEKFDPDTNTSYHVFDGHYWDAKLNKDYTVCPDIF